LHCEQTWVAVGKQAGHGVVKRSDRVSVVIVGFRWCRSLTLPEATAPLPLCLSPMRCAELSILAKFAIDPT
jgi:hypothetical protein